MKELLQITDAQVKALKRLKFGPPVTHVYNPLEYARRPYDVYLRRYGGGPKEVVLIGMNPGPWGMIQTGVPFGEITAVRDWMGIEEAVGRPKKLHPKRPVHGFECKRSEVSGKRLWGWARKTFVTPERFFARFFIPNYCPLMFIEADGRNRTPNHIRAGERNPLLEICDRALRETVLYLKPRYVVGIGEFAASRARAALRDLDVVTGRITHPSPANPKANKGWEVLIEKEFSQLGIKILNHE
jgi:single-strand selective monofunctional uracil DNA glycosylase